MNPKHLAAGGVAVFVITWLAFGYAKFREWDAWEVFKVKSVLGRDVELPPEPPSPIPYYFVSGVGAAAAIAGLAAMSNRPKL
jgi:hypothetical protein